VIKSTDNCCSKRLLHVSKGVLALWNYPEHPSLHRHEINKYLSSACELGLLHTGWTNSFVGQQYCSVDAPVSALHFWVQRTITRFYKKQLF